MHMAYHEAITNLNKISFKYNFLHRHRYNLKINLIDLWYNSTSGLTNNSKTRDKISLDLQVK